MRLSTMMRESLIFPDLAGTQKADVLSQMTQAVADQFPEIGHKDLFSVIMERERLNSTGIGSGIAIPHAKLAKAKEHILAFGRSRMGVSFDAIDEKPVHLIFLVVGPVGANEAHLQALARISKFLHDTAFREKLFTAETAPLIYGVMLEKDSEY